MKLTFFGATKEVTGSKFLLETSGKRILIDCGMHQGGRNIKDINFEPFQFKPAKIDYLLLTHAHIDHSGLIPKLVKDGFNGRIITTNATRDLCGIMLRDSAHIQLQENAWDNKKRNRKGLPEREPLYNIEDAERSLEYFEGVDYNEKIELNNDIKISFLDAGHIVGSAHILIESEGMKIGFSGDIGSGLSPLLNKPVPFENIDLLIMESTYGNKEKKNIEDSLIMISDIINEAFRTGGKILIPAFAVGRSQMMLYYLNKLYNQNKIKLIKIFLDSPLAINATSIYKNLIENKPFYFSEEFLNEIKENMNPFEYKNLTLTSSVEESIGINHYDKPAIIISAAGMCNAGRIQHHLKQHIWNPNASIFIVGYQAMGTPGRWILDGNRNISLLGESFEINASVYYMDSFSAHADKEGLHRFVENINNRPRHIFLTHGENDAIANLKNDLEQKFSISCIIPEMGDVFELSKSEIKHIGNETSDIIESIDLSDIQSEGLEVDKALDVLLLIMKRFLSGEVDGKNTYVKILKLNEKNKKALILLKRFSDFLGDAIFDNYMNLFEQDELIDTKLSGKVKEFKKEYFLSIDPVIEEFIKKIKESVKPSIKKE